VQEVLNDIFEYRCWANTRLLEEYAELEREFIGEDGTLAPLRATFVHVLDADRGWRGLYQTGEDPPELSDADFPTADALIRGFKQENEEWKTLLASLDDASLGNRQEWINPIGELSSRPLWQILFHVVNHGAQHRAELAAALTEHGRSPDDLDFVRFLWERDQAKYG
jgi:uncharacterized damage-inducible protein DinB